MKVTVNDICQALEELAPLALQESYDNAGLQIGNRSNELSGILLCIDITEDVVNEAIDNNCNMIVAHHPLIFRGLKSITGENLVERCVLSAIKNDIAIYACHTNLDSVSEGVSMRMANKIGLEKCNILKAKTESLLKLVTFIPEGHVNKVREACFAAGAGHIGNYSNCSYSSPGNGTFHADEKCNPFVGEIGKLHSEPEVRLEMVLPAHLKSKLTKALILTHPYEEPAFDLIPLANNWNTAGYGVIGELSSTENELEFLKRIKATFNVGNIKYTALKGKEIKKVAVCGGSGADLLNTAIAQGADIFISADFKYHDYFIPENRIVIADIGHFESEQFTKEIFFEQLSKKFPKFAIRFSEINTNPINFL